MTQRPGTIGIDLPFGLGEPPRARRMFLRQAFATLRREARSRGVTLFNGRRRYIKLDGGRVLRGVTFHTVRNNRTPRYDRSDPYGYAAYSASLSRLGLD